MMHTQKKSFCWEGQPGNLHLKTRIVAYKLHRNNFKLPNPFAAEHQGPEINKNNGPGNERNLFLCQLACHWTHSPPQKNTGDYISAFFVVGVIVVIVVVAVVVVVVVVVVLVLDFVLVVFVLLLNDTRAIIYMEPFLEKKQRKHWIGPHKKLACIYDFKSIPLCSYTGWFDDKIHSQDNPWSISSPKFTTLLLMEEIPSNHLGCVKPLK